jgi:hypothetical protein
MLLPAMAFVIGCTAYAILGLVVLAWLPALRLTFFNLFVFVAGAFCGGVAFLFVYGRLFMRADFNHVAFYGIFPTLIVGGAIGGTLLVWVKTRLVRARGTRPPL